MFARVTALWNSWKSALLSGGFLAIIVLLAWGANAFSQLSLALSNTYFIPTPTSESIVIVAIDNASLSEYGRTPAEWSRELYGQIAEIVAKDNARVIAYDLIFSEATDDDEAFAQSLLNARQSEARTRIVLGGAGAQQPSSNTTLDGFPDGLSYSFALTPTEELQAIADYIGYVNAFADVDSRIRRQPSVIQINDQLNFSFSLTIFFAQRRIPSAALSQIVTAENGVLNLTETLSLSVDERGLWQQNFFGAPYIPDTNVVFPVVSFRDVIQGDYETGLFDDKIVLVGLIDSMGATDNYPVPSSTQGALMSGVEIQAHAIETLLSGTPLIEQSQTSQALMIIGLTLVTSLIYEKPRWYWKLILWFISLMIFLVTSFLIFTSQQQIINLFYGGLAISLPALSSVGFEISREINRRRRTEFLLQSVFSVSQQEMVIDNILPLIAHDVQYLIPNSGGFIRIFGAKSAKILKEHRWKIPVGDRTLDELSRHVQKNQKTLQTNKQVVVPINWQSNTLAIIAVQGNSSVHKQQIKILEDLAERLAPTLDNILLHRSIDQQNQLLELILNSSPTNIVLVDHTLTILRANIRFGNWVHHQPDTLIATKLVDSLKQRDVSEDTLAKITSLTSKHDSFEIELRDDQNHVLRLSAVPLGALGHWIMILVDITDLVHLSELRTQMIRMASHDIKNPLSRVLGYSELISVTGELNSMQERYMKHIINAGDEINQIITDILDLEQLRAGQMEREPASFKKLVSEIFTRHEPDKDRKNQTMTLDVPETDLIVNMDYLRLGQAISNLIGNAIKYTPDDGTVTIRIIQTDEGHVQLEIEDNGYGIPAAAQEKLFTEFYRVKTKSTRDISGTGLGLSLVKSVAQAHDGDVWVKSVENEGSTFYLKLPIMYESMENATE